MVLPPADLLWVWHGFWLLHRCRPVGWTVGAIPMSEVLAYTEIHPVPDREMFSYLVAHMDSIWLQKHHERAQAADRARGKRDVSS